MISYIWPGELFWSQSALRLHGFLLTLKYIANVSIHQTLISIKTSLRKPICRHWNSIYYIKGEGWRVWRSHYFLNVDDLVQSSIGEGQYSWRAHGKSWQSVNRTTTKIRKPAASTWPTPDQSEAIHSYAAQGPLLHVWLVTGLVLTSHWDSGKRCFRLLLSWMMQATSRVWRPSSHSLLHCYETHTPTHTYDN